MFTVILQVARVVDNWLAVSRGSYAPTAQLLAGARSNSCSTGRPAAPEAAEVTVPEVLPTPEADRAEPLFSPPGLFPYTGSTRA